MYMYIYIYIYIYIHRLVMIQYTCVSSDAVNIDWWICMSFCRAGWETSSNLSFASIYWHAR